MIKFTLFHYHLLIVVSCMGLSSCGGGSDSSNPSESTPLSPAPRNFTLSIVNAAFGQVNINQDTTTQVCAAGETCSYEFAENTSITLNAIADSGYALQNWSGACTGNSSCNITLSNDATVTTSYTQLFGADLACTENTPTPAIPDINWQTFTTGLNNPTAIASSNDNSQRLFIAEAAGRIRTISSGLLDTDLFLDISNRVWVTETSPANLDELSGLLSIAMHPQFASNGLFYTYYISGTGAGSNQCANPSPTQCIIIAEFDSKAMDVASSERKLLDIPMTTNRRLSGHLAFGPENTPLLYISTGVGTNSANDTDADRLNSLVGKVLRVDINNQDTDLEYAIPTNNPFVSSATAAKEIYAYGFANPRQFNFDLLNGNLLLGDRAEINSINAGLDYGWESCGAGSVASVDCYDYDDTSGIGDPQAYFNKEPLVFKSPVSAWTSLVGGIVYRGNSYATLCGAYIYGDFASGNIAALRYSNNTITEQKDLSSLSGITAFGIDQNLAIYATAYASGTVYKLVVP